MKPIILSSLLIFLSFTHVFPQVNPSDSTSKHPGYQGPRVRALLGMNVEGGGETLVTLFYSNGDEVELTAGQGGHIYGGIQVSLNEKNTVYLRSTLGNKFVISGDDNTTIKITRTVWVSTLNFEPIKFLRIGAGMSRHMGTYVNGGGIITNFNMENTNGFTFEAAYAGIGLTMTFMDYTDNNGFEYKANSIGLTVTGTIPRLYKLGN